MLNIFGVQGGLSFCGWLLFSEGGFKSSEKKINVVTFDIPVMFNFLFYCDIL